MSRELMKKITAYAAAATVAATCAPTLAAGAYDTDAADSVRSEQLVADAADTAETGEYSNVFTFTDDAVSAADADGEGFNIKGTALTINAAGTYKITGSCAEGSIKVKKGTTGVKIVFSDLTLTSSTTAPLAINKDGAEATLVIEGTNTLTDAEDPANETSEDAEIADNFEGAAIKVKSGSKLTVTGTGTLSLNGSSCKNGLKGGTNAQVIVGASAADTFTLNISSAKDALASDGSVTVNGGTIVLNSAEDGLKASPDDDDETSAGEVIVNGGNITITAGEDGIQGDGSVTINGGSIDVISTDEGVQADGGFIMNGGTLGITAGGGAAKATSDSGAKGIKSDTSMTITGGTLTVDASDDALHLNGTAGTETIAITGGTVNISAGDDGIHSDYFLNIGERNTGSSPEINITKACEGIEGAVVNFYSGKGTIVTSDDGVNAANSDLSNYAFKLNIYGGEWYVNAAGDGLDSNGDLNVYGGYTTVFGSANGGNAALDYGDSNASFTYSGGTIAGIGMSDMAVVPTSGTYVTFGSIKSGPGGGMGGPGGQTGSGDPGGMGGFGGFGGGQQQTTGTAISVSTGTKIAVMDSSGNTVFETTAVKTADSIVLASDKITEGQSYSLYLNGSLAATSTASSGSGTPGFPDEPTGNNTISVMSNGREVFAQTLSDAMEYIAKENNANADYVITLSKDTSETSLTIPAKAKSVTIRSSSPDEMRTIDLTGVTTLNAKTSLTLENVKINATTKKGAAANLTISASGDLVLNNVECASLAAVKGKATAALTVGNCSDITAVTGFGTLNVNGILTVNKTLTVNTVNIGAQGVLTAGSGSTFTIKTAIHGDSGAQLRLANGYKAVKLNGTATGSIALTADSAYSDGSFLFTAKTADLGVFDASGISPQSDNGYVLSRTSGKVYLREAKMTMNGEKFALFSDIAEKINSAADSTATYTVELLGDYANGAALKMPAAGKYKCLTITSDGKKFTFTGALTMTGELNIDGTSFYAANKNTGAKVKYSIKAGKYALNVSDSDLGLASVTSSGAVMLGDSSLTGTIKADSLYLEGSIGGIITNIAVNTLRASAGTTANFLNGKKSTIKTGLAADMGTLVINIVDASGNAVPTFKANTVLFSSFGGSFDGEIVLSEVNNANLTLTKSKLVIA